MCLPRFMLVSVVGLLLAAPARADVIILVTASVGPNIFNSPSYESYRDNAQQGLQNSLAVVGTPSTPSLYEGLLPSASVPITDLVVTDFPSWRGNADPIAAYGPAFGSETGTRLYFGLAILPVPNTPSTPFSISQLRFDATSTDPFNSLDFSFAAGEYDYNDDYVGLRLNPDGSVLERITSGPNTQLVDALVSRGSTNAFEVLTSMPGATNQDKIAQELTGINGFQYTGQYTLGDVSGQATVNVVPLTPVPLPPSVIGLGIGAIVLLMRRRI